MSTLRKDLDAAVGVFTKARTKLQKVVTRAQFAVEDANNSIIAAEEQKSDALLVAKVANNSLDKIDEIIGEAI